MKKVVYVVLMLVIMCFVLFVARRYNLAHSESYDIDQVQINTESDTTENVNDINVTDQNMCLKLNENTYQFFSADNMIDLGNHVVAYQMSADEKIRSVFGSYNFSEKGYIAICSIPFDEEYRADTSIHYLPNDYGNIMEMRMEDSGELYICYAEEGSSREEEVLIPIYQPSQEENVIDVNEYMLPKRRIVPNQEGLKAGEQGFPRTVWTEYFQAEGHSYEVAFDRVSPVYNLITDIFGECADYALSVKDENGTVISWQRVINFPVEYEEVHDMIDFSGDGFLDITFCTYMYPGRNSSSDVMTLIWDSEEKIYKEKSFPLNYDNWDAGHVLCAFQTWNEELSAVSGLVGEDEYGYFVLERYSFVNGNWRCVGKVEPLYDENKRGETEEPVCVGYHEVLYDENGGVIEDNEVEGGIWLDEESVWSWRCPENIKLYPEDMDRMEVDIGGIVVTKYVMTD